MRALKDRRFFRLGGFESGRRDKERTRDNDDDALEKAEEQERVCVAAPS